MEEKVIIQFKGGDIFLFTKNSKIILKSVKEEEFTIFKKNIENYFNYLTNNNN